MRNRSNYPKPSTLLLIILFTVIACSVQRKGGKTPAAPVVTITPSPRTFKDTTPEKKPPRRQITKKEMDEYMASVYQENYNRFFAPDFKKQRDEQREQNEKLLKDIHLLTATNKMNMNIIFRQRRKRDSLEHTAEYWQAQAVKYQIENIKAKRESTAQFKQYLEKTDTNFKSLNKFVIWLFIGGLCLGFITLILAIIVWSLRRKVRHLSRQLPHA